MYSDEAPEREQAARSGGPGSPRPEVPLPLAALTRLGPYEILAPLVAGGMDEVYRARGTQLGREVAIKVLAGSLSVTLADVLKTLVYAKSYYASALFTAAGSRRR